MIVFFFFFSTVNTIIFILHTKSFSFFFSTVNNKICNRYISLYMLCCDWLGKSISPCSDQYLAVGLICQWQNLSCYWLMPAFCRTLSTCNQCHCTRQSVARIIICHAVLSAIMPEYLDLVRWRVVVTSNYFCWLTQAWDCFKVWCLFDLGAVCVISCGRILNCKHTIIMWL